MAGKGDDFGPRLRLQNTGLDIAPYVLDSQALRRSQEQYSFKPSECVITDFYPRQGTGGSMIVLVGNGFASNREDNEVTIAGARALVVEAQPNRMVVISNNHAKSGAIHVVNTSSEGKATSRGIFKVIEPHLIKEEADGPPISLAGRILGGPGPPTSFPIVRKVLVVLCQPSDKTAPANFASNTTAKCTTVSTYYSQISYNKLDVQFTFVALFSLSQPSTHYFKGAAGGKGYPNIDELVLSELWKECADHARDLATPIEPNDFVTMCTCIYLPSPPGEDRIRGWQHDTDKHPTVGMDSGKGLIAVAHNSTWDRIAHEIGHSLVEGGNGVGTTGYEEDIYVGDGVEDWEASAQNFDLMGNHTLHPMFSGYFMDQQQFYKPENILSHPDIPDYTDTSGGGVFRKDVELVAHGDEEIDHAASDRYHLIKIKVFADLYYFVEVRQTPDLPSILYDTGLSTFGGPDAGVLVTKVTTGPAPGTAPSANNFRVRFITLLQDNAVLLTTGQTAEDPLRNIRIQVLDDNVEDRPRVCRVRVEWRQPSGENRDGLYDLRITDWDHGPNWETPDIWIDRDPFGTYDYTNPTTGLPILSGDRPAVGEVNRFWARIQNYGFLPANNVKVTWYSITPPGVGDNGTWTPLSSQTFLTIPPNTVDWMWWKPWRPSVAQHTCMKVVISHKADEYSASNNAAQENIFNFDTSPGGSGSSLVADPVEFPIAVRNPFQERTRIFLGVSGVPEGFHAYFPKSHVWLEGLGEETLDLLVIPTAPLSHLKVPYADVRVEGYATRHYTKPLCDGEYPTSSSLKIGGIRLSVTVKESSEIKLDERFERTEPGDGKFQVFGTVTPSVSGQRVRVKALRDGSQKVSEVFTRKQGRFNAAFDLSAEKGGGGGKVIVSLQAEIFNADRLAPAQSNVVWFEL
ncbi:hypothetical protein LTR84_012507 [Exophiala bonariae]|uniref:IPT/TIG domain-containing protein n=1 Tax=Exophiala bonariae TaxID=1690606 RepID=A0AAV9NIM8_9EURO|nr:hypothetical protein LTR84_012507 [Exophiala bonariae]